MDRAARSLAEQLIHTNSGKNLKVLEHGVCLILKNHLRGVVVKTSEGFYFVARADQTAPNGYCVEIDIDTVARSINMPDGYFTSKIRVISRDTSIGVWMGSYDVGEWTDGVTFIPRHPKVLQWFTEWSNK